MTQQQTSPSPSPLNYQIPALHNLGAGRAMAIIGAVSLAAVAFLFWLIYFRSAAGHVLVRSSRRCRPLNATLNGLSAIFLIIGYIAVRRRQFARHITFMLAAVGSSRAVFRQLRRLPQLPRRHEVPRRAARSGRSISSS